MSQFKRPFTQSSYNLHHGQQFEQHTNQKIEELENSQNPYESQEIEHNANPTCKCGRASEIKVVKKEGPTQGKEFFACSQPQEQSCGFFQWVVPQAPKQTKKRPFSEWSASTSAPPRDDSKDAVLMQTNAKIAAVLEETVISLTNRVAVLEQHIENLMSPVSKK